MSRPRLLDLFCGEGGAAYGYWLAGWDVFGCDIEPQPNYPFPFRQCDAMSLILNEGHRFDAVHASPVCKRYSACSVLNDVEHPDQIPGVRRLLIELGKPWVIENVPGAPLFNPAVLCGAMFGLRTYRHRLFETNFPLVAPMEPLHVSPLAKMGRPVMPGEFIQVVGHYSDVRLAREVMGMPWGTRDGMAQAVPTAYTEYVGRYLLDSLP